VSERVVDPVAEQPEPGSRRTAAVKRVRAAVRRLKFVPFDMLADADAMQMAREFGKIGDIKSRRAVLAVVETLAGKA
jgi:hypothetical protein